MSTAMRMGLAALSGGGSGAALAALALSRFAGSVWPMAAAGAAASLLAGAAVWIAARARALGPAEAPSTQALFDAEAVELAHLRLEARIDELTLLHDVTRSLTSTLELDELFRRLAELIGATGSFDSFAILHMDEEQSGLAVRTAFGFPPGQDPAGIRLPVSDHTCRRAMQSREHVITRPDPAGPARLEGLGWAPADGALLTMAMRHKDRVEGLLVFSRAESKAFTPSELELLRNIAGQAALAISNARLFEQTVKLSLTDPLTGLHNRRHFFSKLDLEVMRARRYGASLSMAMIDIDHFKTLNDTHGHAAGDVVLQEMAAVLQNNVRRMDTVARFGGEEFCVILPNVRREEAGIAAEKLRRLIEATSFPGGETQPGGRFTVSLGYATFPEDADDLDGLLEAADLALYASKREGRNRSTPFTPSLRDRRAVQAIAQTPKGPESAPAHLAAASARRRR